MMSMILKLRSFKKLIKVYGFKSVITTKGSDGISVVRKDGHNFHIP